MESGIKEPAEHVSVITVAAFNDVGVIFILFFYLNTADRRQLLHLDASATFFVSWCNDM